MGRTSSFVMAGALAAALLTSGGAAVAAHGTEVDVYKNGDGGWSFNRDPANATPYNFSTDEASLGFGSLYVEPLSAEIGDRKFIAELGLDVDVDEFNKINYDFLVDTDDVTDTEEFYLNVYTNLPGSTSFYDCRYNYVPQDGPTGEWRTMSTDEGVDKVFERNVPDGTCGSSLADLPDDSTVKFIALNVGDTSTGDANVAGYFDNVVVDLDSSLTTYDFEPSVTTKDDCKQGGFAAYGYKNQGECVSEVNKAEKEDKADKPEKDKKDKKEKN